MKKTKLLAIALLIASPVLAGMSKKYKPWNKSPDAYFLTLEEKAEWKKIKSDDDAEKFIASYRAKRPAAFWEEISKRVAAADKYFSAGSTKGSETLRGKVVILFGPPSNIGSGGPGAGADPSRNGDAVRSAVAQSAAADAGRGGGAGVDMGSGGGGNPLYAPHSSGVSRQSYPTITIFYDDSAAPKSIGKPFHVEVRMISATNQEPVDEKDLDEKTEAVSKASMEPAPVH
jgi:GWxTD domain-containing protein